MRAAIYTRKSTEDGLEQDFNSLDAQREACAAYIQSQRHEGWTKLERYEDGGWSRRQPLSGQVFKAYLQISQKVLLMWWWFTRLID